MHIPRPLTLLTLLGLLLGGLLVATPRPAAAQGAACFAETGFCVQGRFLASWQQNGGLAQFGFPLSEEMPEILPEGRNSPAYVVQYLERARFEYHDEFAGTPSEVLLGQFERRILAENDTPRGNPDIFALYITDQARRERPGAPLGEPPAPPARVQAVTQAFERDRMLFLPNPYLVPTPLGTPPAATIVAFCGDRAGVYYPAPDTWAEGQPPGGGPGPRAELYEPQRGFGKVWRADQRVRDCPGYALTPDEQTAPVAVGLFQCGRLLTADLATGRTLYYLTFNTVDNGGFSGDSGLFKQIATPIR